MTSPARTARTICVVAAEESGDRLGGALIRALKRRAGMPLRFAGVGASAMAAEGVASPFPIEDLSIMGLGAIPGRLRTILRHIREAADLVIAAEPDVLVIIDSPEFTHRVARRVRAARPDIPIVDYVSPSVWAWRPGRARAMRRYVDHVLAILPFEPAEHGRLGGPRCSYVGHPLTERVGALRPNSQEAERRRADPPVVLVLPGSRRGEVNRLTPIFAAAMRLVAERSGPLDLVIPTLPHLADRVRAATDAWPVAPRILTDAAEKDAALRTARVALAKSGTVTLELALAGVPMVAAYRGNPVEGWLAKRLVRLPSVILANLVLQENAVPEFMQGDCTPQRLADALLPLIGDTPQRRRQAEAFARLDAVMEIGRAVPAERAAALVLAAAEGGRRAAASG
jgi:lipid-A-disaccharide synthase